MPLCALHATMEELMTCSDNAMAVATYWSKWLCDIDTKEKEDLAENSITFKSIESN